MYQKQGDAKVMHQIHKSQTSRNITGQTVFLELHRLGETIHLHKCPSTAYLGDAVRGEGTAIRGETAVRGDTAIRGDTAVPAVRGDTQGGWTPWGGSGR